MPLGYAFADILLAAKQCYHCQGLGHVQADCPTLRISGASTGGRCYSCGQPGHLAVSIYHSSLRIKLTVCKRACPNNGFHAIPPMGIGRGNFIPRGGFGGGFRGGFAGAPRPATCYKCGGPNHYARDCQAQAMKCYACGKLVSATIELSFRKPQYLLTKQGHISRDCTAPNGGPLNAVGKVCYKCGQAGHISRECTTVDTNGQIVLDVPVDTINQVQLATTPTVV